MSNSDAKEKTKTRSKLIFASVLFSSAIVGLASGGVGAFVLAFCSIGAAGVIASKTNVGTALFDGLFSLASKIAKATIINPTKAIRDKTMEKTKQATHTVLEKAFGKEKAEKIENFVKQIKEALTTNAQENHSWLDSLKNCGRSGIKNFAVGALIAAVASAFIQVIAPAILPVAALCGAFAAAKTGTKEISHHWNGNPGQGAESAPEQSGKPERVSILQSLKNLVGISGSNVVEKQGLQQAQPSIPLDAASAATSAAQDMNASDLAVANTSGQSAPPVTSIVQQNQAGASTSL